jgi:DNA-binding NtrC family response regulator
MHAGAGSCYKVRVTSGKKLPQPPEPATDDSPEPLVASAALVGESAPMSRVRSLVDRVAVTDVSVLLIGESGTGKEVVAQALHAGSPRADREFRAINCGAIPATLIEAELFGFERGSFTGATRTHRGIVGQAHGGTLFLDEITEMPMETQPPLLRFLETRRYFRVGGTRELATDVRIIAATNRPPALAVRENRLRQDLYYRLAAFPIELPPLRERGDDVVELAELFLQRLNDAAGTAKRFSAGSLDVARRHAWPGNVRELKHAVECAFILGDRVVDLRSALATSVDLPARAMPPRDGGDGLYVLIGSRLSDVERWLIEATLKRVAGNKRRAADVLGCSVKTLYNKLNRYAQPAGET